MSEHSFNSALGQSNNYYQSPEYFRSLDTPLSDEMVEARRREHEPIRYSEDGKRIISAKKTYSELYDQIHQSSLDNKGLQVLRAVSAEYVTRIAQIAEDESEDDARMSVLRYLVADLPEYGTGTIEGLQRYEYPDGSLTLMLDGAPIEDMAEVYKEIAPPVIRPTDFEWDRSAIDTPLYDTAQQEPYDVSSLELPETDELFDELDPLPESVDDIIGYEVLHQTKLIVRRLGVHAIGAVTGQLEKIERLLKTAA